MTSMPLKDTAELAYQRFRDGWRTGDWEPFLAMLSDDFIFQFPAGPFKGRHFPPDGKCKMIEWAHYYSASGDRINITPNLAVYQDDWGVFSEDSMGQEGGVEYRGTEAIFLRVRDGKLIEYREYIGDITDWVRLETKKD